MTRYSKCQDSTHKEKQLVDTLSKLQQLAIGSFQGTCQEHSVLPSVLYLLTHVQVLLDWLEEKEACVQFVENSDKGRITHFGDLKVKED
jgi:hypothetical protein